jgi:hypothetical protein
VFTFTVKVGKATYAVTIRTDSYHCTCDIFRKAESVCRHFCAVTRLLFSTSRNVPLLVVSLVRTIQGTKWFPYRGGRPTQVAPRRARVSLVDAGFVNGEGLTLAVGVPSTAISPPGRRNVPAVALVAPATTVASAVVIREARLPTRTSQRKRACVDYRAMAGSIASAEYPEGHAEAI